jgi:hypothetical protein
MIVSLREQVEEVIQATLTEHVTAASETIDLVYAVNCFSETEISMSQGGGTKVVQRDCLGVWLYFDAMGQRYSTQLAIPLEDYTPKALREHLLSTWDLLMVDMMERRIRES